ncbi:MAG: DNA-3-methyladenine glycosylase [Saprospiraceae bacterium]
MKILPKSFYLSSDVQQIAQNLLGKILWTNINHQVSYGRIVETEAYQAPHDKASHAYNWRKTNRTQTMFLEGGHAYIYLCYGIHHLFNVVTGQTELPHAILIRGLEPLYGMELMAARTNKPESSKTLSNGPGSLSKALGITTKQDAINVYSPESEIKIMDDGFQLSKKEIIAGPRVGIDYAEEYISKPWRYFITGNRWVSNKDGIKSLKQ